jgi:hypothetical protein
MRLWGRGRERVSLVAERCTKAAAVDTTPPTPTVVVHTALWFVESESPVVTKVADSDILVQATGRLT